MAAVVPLASVATGGNYPDPAVGSDSGDLSGSGIEVRGNAVALPDGRVVETMAAPISIDAGEFTRHATAPQTDADHRVLRAYAEERAYHPEQKIEARVESGIEEGTREAE